jgi:hypothetical protein
MNRAERRHAARNEGRIVKQRIRPTERLSRGQINDLALIHLVNLDQISKGRGTEDTLHQWVGAVFTWTRVAELNAAGIPEMAEQMKLAEAVLERYRTTGRIIFTGPEYQTAKAGVQFMDQLAELTPKLRAIHAANWSEKRIEAFIVERTKLSDQAA